MTDELYDYFGGNASKKVEPIEDDDLDLDADDEAQGDPSNESNDEDTTLCDEVTVSDVKAAADTSTEEAEPEGETKKAGHWDFLANMLGISTPKSSSKSVVSKKEVATNEKTEVVTSESKSQPSADVDDVEDPASGESELKETATRESGKDDFFGLDPISSPEDETVLPAMFVAPKDERGDAKAEDVVMEVEEIGAEIKAENDDLIGWDPLPKKSFTIDSEQKSEATCDPVVPEEEIPYEEDYEEFESLDSEEFVEFEIEELDVSPRDENEDAAHGRRRRKPSSVGDSSESDDDEKRTRRGRSGSSRSQPSSSQSRFKDDRCQDSRSEGRPKRGRRRQTEARDNEESRMEEPRRGRKRRPRRGREEDAGREEKPRRGARSNQPQSRQTENDRDESRDRAPVFGAGLEDVDWETDSEQVVEKPVRSRSKRGRSEREKSNRDRSDRDRSDRDDFGGPESSESGRKRRRRRGGKRKTERIQEDIASEKPKSGFGAGIIDDDDADFDSNLDIDSFDDPSDIDDFDSDNVGTDRNEESTESSPRRGRSRRRRSGQRGESRNRDRSREDERDVESDYRNDGDRKRAKVPTWDDTIAVLIESNIKNHKKTGGSRRSGGSNSGGGRGRGGNGGGSRDSGGGRRSGSRGGGSRSGNGGRGGEGRGRR